jgi:hypothetical protein
LEGAGWREEFKLIERKGIFRGWRVNGYDGCIGFEDVNAKCQEEVNKIAYCKGVWEVVYARVMSCK